MMSTIPGPQMRGTRGTRRTERTFWQARYYDFNVHSSRKGTEKLDYMHRNPVRGSCAKPEDWPWSSFRHYRTGLRGIVEVESLWTAARRGYEFPEGFQMREPSA